MLPKFNVHSKNLLQQIMVGLRVLHFQQAPNEAHAASFQTTL